MQMENTMLFGRAKKHYLCQSVFIRGFLHFFLWDACLKI